MKKRSSSSLIRPGTISDGNFLQIARFLLGGAIDITVGLEQESILGEGGGISTCGSN